jgi:hypothetical protein
MDFTGADLEPAQEREQRKKLLALVRMAAREAKAGADIFDDQNIQRAMFEMSKCPDYVINKGHYFGTDLFTEEPGLSDAQKMDLIAFLKTM